MSDTITYTTSTGANIERIIDRLEPVITSESSTDIMMAFIAVCLMFQAPKINKFQLADGIRGTSEWMAAFASSLEDGPDKKAMN